MAKYLVTFESCEADVGGDCVVIAQSRGEVDAIITKWLKDGYMDDGEMPIVYELGKKMTVKVETKIVVKGAS